MWRKPVGHRPDSPLEFGVQATDENDPDIKWREDSEKGVYGNWKPATGVVDGQTLALTSKYFKQNTKLASTR
jgi:hypothetical protein